MKGFAIGPDVDYQKIDGVAAAEEPCLKGYERQRHNIRPDA
jgi:hypothetical protein